MIKDVTDREFEAEVLEASKDLPVIVDFWAPWCGPCRALTPALEQAVTAREGRVKLVKVNTDENPGLSATFQIQSIPTVMAFKDGKLADHFFGAQPPPMLDRFIDGLLPTAAEEALAAGDEDALRAAVEADPANPEARCGLARMLLRAGRAEDAVEVLDGAALDTSGEGLLARARLAAEPQADPQAAAALAQLDAAPEAALDALLELVRAAADAERRDALRVLMLGVFAELGLDDPLVPAYRKRLATALY